MPRRKEQMLEVVSTINTVNTVKNSEKRGMHGTRGTHVNNEWTGSNYFHWRKFELRVQDREG